MKRIKHEYEKLNVLGILMIGLDRRKIIKNQN